MFKSRQAAFLIPLLFIGCLRAQSRWKPDSGSAIYFERVLALAPEEGVFAYSRISPDGRYLAYASELTENGATTQSVTVIDLAKLRVVFREEGLDAYFSNDGKRMIYMSNDERKGSGVAIWHLETGMVSRNIGPASLGDYFSWGRRDQRDVIMTVRNNYFFLEGDKAVLPHFRVVFCPNFALGERPLMSKDGLRVTTFVRGQVIVRAIDNCEETISTGISGAKADFSFDHRYVAMHVPKPAGVGYDICVVDLLQKTTRIITSSLSGSSFFPSWTLDGRLAFRYDGEEYRGFVLANNILSVPAKPLDRATAKLPESRSWNDLFPESNIPQNDVAVVLVWGAWSAHIPKALRALERARQLFQMQGLDVAVLTAVDPVTREHDSDRLLGQSGAQIRRIPLASSRLTLTELNNQNPVTLLFRGGRLIDRRLGAQTYEELVEWMSAIELYH